MELGRLMTVEEKLEFLEKFPCGILEADDPFFGPGNKRICGKYKKMGAILKPDSREPDPDKQILCRFAGCNQIFTDTPTYESHYNTAHFFACSICNRSFPSSYLLDLHISEMHDTFFAARVERGDLMFRCLVDICEHVFKTSEERKKHVMKIHHYPYNFPYFPDKRKPKKEKPKGPKEKREDKMELDNETEGAEGGASNALDHKLSIEDKVTKDVEIPSTSSRRPPKYFQFSFGQVNKTFASKKNKKHQKSKLDDLSDLKDALDETME